MCILLGTSDAKLNMTLHHFKVLLLLFYFIIYSMPSNFLLFFSDYKTSASKLAKMLENAEKNTKSKMYIIKELTTVNIFMLYFKFSLT